MADKLKLRRDSSTNWINVNPILDSGEVGFETNTRKLKVGDGSTQWTNLPYASITSVDLENGLLTKANIANTLAGYGITNAYTITEVTNLLLNKADKNNVYTKTESNTLLNAKVNLTDVLNVLTSTDATKPLSANQGRVLKGLIDNLNTLVLSDDSNLDELQEIVNYIKLNRADLEALNVNSIIGLVDALASKVDATNLKTIDNQSILGTGNIEVVARKTVLGIAKFVSNDYYIKLKKYIDEQINKLKTKSYSFKWEIVSINANTQLELYVANKDIAKNDGIVFTNLSAGALIISTVAKAGGVTINLYNPTASAISFSNTLLNTDIKYLIIKGAKK